MSSANCWRVPGLRPQPSVLPRQRTWRRRAGVTTKLFRTPAVRRRSLRSLEGVVYGSDGTPLADALVHLSSINRSTRTGRHGEFKFELIPVGDVKKLLVKARGKVMTIEILNVPWPLAIYFQLES